MDEGMRKAGNFLPRAEPEQRPGARANLPVNRGPGLVAITAPASVAAEQYRVLYHRIERMRQQREMKVITLTSAVPGEGKSLTVVNLALVAAASDPRRKVLVIDGDLRRPRLGSLLDVEERPGLGEFLAGEVTLPEVVRRVPGSPLQVITAGAPREDAGMLLAGQTMRLLLEQARTHWDEIYLDASPVLPVADGALLAGLGDGVVLVVKAGETSRTLVSRAIETLSGARLLGCVLNGVDAGEVPYLSNKLR
ncbi:MAG TPA: CpsD/CapB family tyrosine-protein kinase [Myxococcales bacterium]|jgi:capsular exopolysaccharide synthesis family protein